MMTFERALARRYSAVEFNPVLGTSVEVQLSGPINFGGVKPFCMVKAVQIDSPIRLILG